MDVIALMKNSETKTAALKKVESLEDELAHAFEKYIKSSFYQKNCIKYIFYLSRHIKS